jgi:hypothetical protein
MLGTLDIGIKTIVAFQGHGIRQEEASPCLNGPNELREPVSNTPLEMWIEINASKIRAVTKSACI